MKDARRKQMEALITQRETVSMEELRDTFGVSMNTVRSDVAYLVDAGAAEKIYGGVRILRDREVPLFAHRVDLNTESKRRIARRAEALIQDKDILFIDAGTTTMYLIDFLDPNKRVTIVTGSLPVISRASGKTNVELVVLPGVLNHRTNTVADVSTLEFLGRYRCTRAFMGASGVSPDGKLNVSTYIEYELKKLAVQQSLHAYLLVDAAKFGGESLMAYGTLGDMAQVITDPQCPPALRELCRQQDVPLTIVE